MNIIADDRIPETRDFTNQFVLFPARSAGENWGEQPPSRLSRKQLDAFLSAQSDNARSAHFFVPPAEPPGPTPEKGLAAGVLKQAACDLRRFHAATTGVKREIYLDAYSWINANDFFWPYSFLNVCKLLDLCPEVIRAELLSDELPTVYGPRTRLTHSRPAPTTCHPSGPFGSHSQRRARGRNRR